MPQPKVYLRAAAKILGLHKSSKARRRTSYASTSSSDEDDALPSPSFSHSNGRRLSIGHQLYIPTHCPRSQGPATPTLPQHQYPHFHQSSEAAHKRHSRNSTFSLRYLLQFPAKDSVTLRRRATVLGSNSATCHSNTNSRNSSQQSLYSLVSTNSLKPYSSKLYRRSGPVPSPSPASHSQSAISKSLLHRSKSMPSHVRRLRRQSPALVLDIHLSSDTLIQTPTTTTAAPLSTRPCSSTTPMNATSMENKHDPATCTSTQERRQSKNATMVVVEGPDSHPRAGFPVTRPPSLTLASPTSLHRRHGLEAPAGSTEITVAKDSDAIVPTTHRSQGFKELAAHYQRNQPSSSLLLATMEDKESSTLSQLHLRQKSRLHVATSSTADSKTTVPPASAMENISLLPPPPRPAVTPLSPSAEKGRLPQRPVVMTRNSSVAAMSLCSIRSLSSISTKKSSRSYHSSNGGCDGDDNGCCNMSIHTYESEQSQLEAALRHHSDILPSMDEMMVKVGHCLASEDGHVGAQLVEHEAARTVAQHVELVESPQIAIVEPCSAKIETWIN